MLQRLLVSSLLLLAVSVPASARHRARTYRVTIQNLTKGQVLSPSALATHTSRIAIFEAGEPASDELAKLAEDGMTAPLVALLSGAPQVFQASATDGPVPPGQSQTTHIRSTSRFRFLSLVTMLVNTNDAFAAANTVSLPRRLYQTKTVNLLAYDAGSEGNNENCAFVPGPACGGGSERDTANAEGFVFVHNGVHGIADLDPAAYDWRNPVVRISITRIR